MSDRDGPPPPRVYTDAEIQAAHIGGARRHDRQIHLAEYDPAWASTFAREAERIRAALGERVLQLEHVGSTSVPGLAAKPIVDMLLVLADPADEPSYVPALEAAGYRLEIREPEWFEHRMFVRDEPRVQVHVLPPGCVEIDRMVGFRDHLRSNAEDRALYERTKRDLASRTWAYTQNYADAKTEVVDEITARAGLPAREF